MLPRFLAAVALIAASLFDAAPAMASGTGPEVCADTFFTTGGREVFDQDRN